jgi:DNA-binding winged helix-turn-helix (wHTH) protein
MRGDTRGAAVIDSRTYKEFELLKYLARHAGQVFTRAQLLQEVWGYDFFGGTRTVDVHVRRLRAKLGTEHEQMIGTVRNVGYKLGRPGRSALGKADAIAAGPDENDDGDRVRVPDIDRESFKVARLRSDVSAR